MRVPTDAVPYLLTASRDYIFFADTRGLWRSDGTAAGTNIVRDIAPGAAGSYPGLAAVNDLLFFTANDGSNA